MTSWPALDVAIGLIFVYFLLSLFASNINEILATWLKLRARDLETWLTAVLVDDKAALEDRKKSLEEQKKTLEDELRSAADAERPDLQTRLESVKTSLAASETKLAAFRNKDELKTMKKALGSFFESPLLRAAIKSPRDVSPGSSQGRRPSYIASEVFSAVVTVAPGCRDLSEVPKTVRAAIGNLPSEYLRRVATSLCDETTKEVSDLRKKLEGWYDESMQRVSGWYKRRAQLFVFLIGLALAIGLNIDTIQITRTLWSDSTVRAAVVAAAGSAAQSGQSPSSQAVANEVQQLSASNLPLGWGAFSIHGSGQWFLKALGWLITALAVVLGAPFWFDLLSRFTNVRFSGAPPDVAQK